MNERLITGAVAIPGEPDYDGEILTNEEIRHAAEAFIENYGVIDPEHVCALTNECFSVAVPVDSKILEEDMLVKSLDGNEMNLPAGSWILTVDVTNDDEWQRIVDGEATGFSLTASSAMDPLKSRKLIRDLGDGWVARTVSIVANPAVPKAKFFNYEVSNMENKSKFEQFYEKVESAFKSMSNDSEETVMSSDEDVVKSSEEVEEIVEEEVVKSEDKEIEVDVESLKSEDSFITMEELEAAKSDILEAVKSMMVESEEAIKSKDDNIKNLSEKVDDLESRLEEATKSRSKGLPAHLDTTGELEVVKTRWVGLGDNRDMYGRVIKQ